MLFNIGYHTAHHEHPQLHWTRLPDLYQRNYLGHINPVLNEASLSHYVLRTFVLGAALPRFRSRSLPRIEIYNFWNRYQAAKLVA